MAKFLFGLFLLVLIAAGTILYLSRRETPPLLAIEQPTRAVGQTGTVTVTAKTPGLKFTALTINVEQNGQTTPIYSLDSGSATPEDPDTIKISRPFGKQSVPSLRSGPARIVVS